MSYFDDLETRSSDERATVLESSLPKQIATAKTLAGYKTAFTDVKAQDITTLTALSRLPVLRKSDLSKAQSITSPLGGFTTRQAAGFGHVFQSPGPIYEPGGIEIDWWRMGRFLHACGIGAGDIVQNCFAVTIMNFLSYRIRYYEPRVEEDMLANSTQQFAQEFFDNSTFCL